MPHAPITIQEGRGDRRVLVYLLHVGDTMADALRYPKGLFESVRLACGPDAAIVVRGDDGTLGRLPADDAPQWNDHRFEVAKLVLAGWSAGVRGIRRVLLEGGGLASNALHRLSGIAACDGLHAPWAERRAVAGRCVNIDGDWWHEPGSCDGCRLELGASEIFRQHVARARRSEFAFVLTHCMQSYMEGPKASPRYLSSATVARELSGWPCAQREGDALFATEFARVPVRMTEERDGFFEVHSYESEAVDHAAHVRQLREALPVALRRLRDFGALAP